MEKKTPIDTIRTRSLSIIAGIVACVAFSAPASAARLVARVIDEETRQPLAARVYIYDAQGNSYFAKSAESGGACVPYDKTRGSRSVERHTSVSPHWFQCDLPPGAYIVEVERGKEYVPWKGIVDIANGDNRMDFPIRRWINMASQGWYSGETHVHRTLEELPTAMLAEDLNVTFPLTYWVTRSHTSPAAGNKAGGTVTGDLIQVDTSHVIFPLNTEYEIFSVGSRRHTLGAVFGLAHQRPLQLGVPPLRPVAEQVHREGGLLELDKHNWPWSMAIIPIMDVDLYELTNNHLWRTEFFFRKFGEPPPAYMKIEQDDAGMTERGWIDYTLQNYYALLNCGFRLRPTAGTASGVHPVPLGFGRVYVYLGDGFDGRRWLQGLDAGRSFVTTGPLLNLRVDGHHAGDTRPLSRPQKVRLQGTVSSYDRLDRIEIIVNGRVVRQLQPNQLAKSESRYQWTVDELISIDGTSWLAVRCFASTDEGRPRFAHTAPWYFDDEQRPLRPRPEEINFLIERTKQEIARARGVLGSRYIEELEGALRRYEEVAESVQ